MKIRKDDYQGVLEHLTNKRWEGEEFVAFLNDGLPASKEELMPGSSVRLLQLLVNTVCVQGNAGSCRRQ